MKTACWGRSTLGLNLTYGNGTQTSGSVTMAVSQCGGSFIGVVVAAAIPIVTTGCDARSGTGPVRIAVPSTSGPNSQGN